MLTNVLKDHVTKYLRISMDTSINKPSNRLSANAEHLLNNPDFAKNDRDSIFSNKSKARSDYNFSVLES